MNPMRNVRLYALAAIVSGWCVVAPFRMAAAETVTESLADGAAVAAGALLAENADDTRGRDLLRFALALDPENRRALLAQARVDRGLPPENTAFADGGAKYVRFVKSVAAKAGNREKQLLLLKVVEMVAPEDDVALVELTKAKNEGIDTAFDSLLAAVIPGAGAAAKGPDSEPDSAPAGTVPAAPLAGPVSLDDFFATATGVRLPIDMYLMVRDPVYAVNALNRLLHGRAAPLEPRPSGVTLRRSTVSNGAPQFSLGGMAAPAAGGFTYIPRTPFSERTLQGDDAVRLLCALHGLGWKAGDGAVVLAPTDDPEVIRDTGICAGTDDLVSDLRKSRTGFRDRYYGRSVFVHGILSGVSIGKGESFIHVGDDQVRLVLDRGVPSSRLEDLKEDYEAVRDLDKRYQNSNERYVVLVAARGRCMGESRSRILIRECAEFSWAPLRTTP